MELRTGYKQTEVGLIPEDWEVKEFGDILESMQLGGNYPNTETATEFPLIKMGNINRGYIEFSKFYFIKSTVRPFPKDKVINEDILFNTRNTLDLVGKVAMWRNELPIAYFNSNIMRLVFKKEFVSSNFFMNNILNTRNSIYQLRGVATGTTSVAAIYSRDLIKIKVPVPPHNEQTAIAKIISDADALITNLEKLIDKKCNIMQGAMQKLLQPKLGWEITTYGEVFDFLPTATYSRADLTENDEVHYIHYGDIHTKWNVFLNIREHESDLPTVSPEQVNNKIFLKEGDVIMADASEDYSGVGKSIEIKNLGSVKAISGLHTMLLRDKGEVFVNGFRGYIHLMKIVKTQFDRLATGLKVYGVSKGNLKTVQIPLPSKDEQARIATILSDMDAEIAALEAKLEKYRKIKLGMMQNLLKGKIRLI